jgi:hypothetical protein
VAEFKRVCSTLSLRIATISHFCDFGVGGEWRADYPFPESPGNRRLTCCLPPALSTVGGGRKRAGFAGLTGYFHKVPFTREMKLGLYGNRALTLQTLHGIKAERMGPGYQE